MELQNWQRQYLDALLRSRVSRITQYETSSFVKSILHEPANGIQELLLHRTIANIESVNEALDLMTALRTTPWQEYESRILARIGDTEAVVKNRPELAEHFRILRENTGYTTYSIKDWKLISDGCDYRLKDAPVWANNITTIYDILEDRYVSPVDVTDLATVLAHFYAADVRIYELGLLANSSNLNACFEVLHTVLTAPYIQIGGESLVLDSMSSNVPANTWAPHWQLVVNPRLNNRWDTHECHTRIKLTGLGTTGIFDQISVLLALSGLLRDGIQLSPIDLELVRSIVPSHPIWGFRRREFSAARTPYQAHDVRALALGFLEDLPSTTRVSMFRSRLAMHLISHAWAYRSTASVVSSEAGFYQHVVRVAQLFGNNRFHELLDYIKQIPYRNEFVFRHFEAEARAALSLFRRAQACIGQPSHEGVVKSGQILCVTHASVPEQTGGYAIRAHGILKSLRKAGINVTAVTRPGFPLGAQTHEETVVVDDVEYKRLPATTVTRFHGEIQYMMSLIRPLKKLFRDRGADVIHVRSTFLIALPTLIAARELGLKILYEVSGLWELVYKDREQNSHILKRSSFAELAETITMTHVDQLVVMNEAVREIAVSRGVDSSIIHIAPNAVEVESFQSLRSTQNRVFTLGYLGSFQDYEGLHDLIDAVQYLRTNEIPLRVLMVGDGPQFHTIRSYVHSRDLSDIVELTGRVAHEDVISYYEKIDVLVYPRRSTGATETITPLKPFEALALAKPVIVSNVRPLAEIAGKNERGLVFQSGDIRDLARSIQLLMNDPSLMRELGERGRDWVVHHRNWKSVVTTFISAYKQLTDVSPK